MKIPLPFKFLVSGMFLLVWISAVTAIAATNTVPSTRADESSAGIGTNSLKPAACAGLYLSGTVSGSGTITGTAGNDLILGSSGADTIDGLGGNDCILGGGGDDLITGGDGTDICLGGSGSNTFTDCEGES
jgi:Ca2+-binding RTX toxin-like protein